MRTSLKGFSYFEVILYLGLFSLLATTVLTFSWNVLDLADKQHTDESLFSDARFLSEKLNTLIRSSSGIDTDASLLNDEQGKLVLSQLNSSDTVTIEIINNQVVLTPSGSETVTLHTSASKIKSLLFQKYGTLEDKSEYIGYTLVLDTVQTDTNSPFRYQTSTTLESGAYIRNSGL